MSCATNEHPDLSPPSLSLPPHHVPKVVHLEGVAKGVRILVVLLDVGLVGHPGDMLPQFLHLILPAQKQHKTVSYQSMQAMLH